jgi:hypothetical protein
MNLGGFYAGRAISFCTGEGVFHDLLTFPGADATRISDEPGLYFVGLHFLYARATRRRSVWRSR